MKYIVRIKATVIKDIEVEADDEERADTEAHEQFTVAPDEDGREKYEQETLSITPMPRVTR